MKFDWKTPEGLKNLLNTFSAIVLLVAATYFHWDSPTPTPAPLPDVTVVAQQPTVVTGEEDSEAFAITGFKSRDQADQAARILVAEPSDSPMPGPVTGFSVGFLVALLNLLMQYFGKRN